MCGIAGLIATRGISEVGRAVELSFERLRHRGPDDLGFLLYSRNATSVGREWVQAPFKPEVILLHRRLSILDLTDAGWQPMGSKDGRYFIVFNGEIYNHIELREQLGRLGYNFKSHSDTEVLIAAYAHWGVQALTRFVGMFAFAILDRKERTVLLARDCFGIKPLYFKREKDMFVFASEAKLLLDLCPGKREVNADYLYLYLRYGITDQGSETLFSGIQQLQAAHYLQLSIDSPSDAQSICYWHPLSREPATLSFEEAAKETRNLFLNNVRLHLRSDVPVGAALSGGIDSSAIVMAMRYIQPDIDVHTFSYVAEDKGISEEPWIDLVSSQASAHVHKVYAGPEALVQDLDKLTYIQDEPFGSTSLYAQYCVFRKAHNEGIKVMLDGQGADEILGGYRYHLAARLASMIRQGQWQQGSEFLSQCARLPGTQKGLLLVRALGYLLPPALEEPCRKLINKDQLPDWLNAGWFVQRGVVPRSLGRCHTSEILRETLCDDLMTSSLPHLLRYEDRNSMAFSIESRVPFLTPELVSFLLSLPEEYLVGRDGTSKAVFRAAMRGIVPDAILDRRDKVAFATPEQMWLGQLTDWVERIFSSEAATQMPVFKLDRLKREWASVLSGRKPFDFRVWRWVNTIQWTKQFGLEYN
jgi:asparagine synthase (glutamine-hydrolysing)